MKHRIEVDYSDGRTESCKVTAKVEVALEQKYEIALSEAGKREHVYYAAWVGLRQAGKESADFEAFIDTVDDARMVEVEVDPMKESPGGNPTRPDGSGS